VPGAMPRSPEPVPSVLGKGWRSRRASTGNVGCLALVADPPILVEDRFQGVPRHGVRKTFRGILLSSVNDPSRSSKFALIISVVDLGPRRWDWLLACGSRSEAIAAMAAAKLAPSNRWPSWE
jgi:hypothetical protein